MDRKMLLNIPLCEAPQRDSTNSVIAVSQIIVDESSERKNIIEVDLYWKNKLRARWYGIEKDKKYVVYIMDKECWKIVKLENAARIIQGKRALTGLYCYNEEVKWNSKEDKARVFSELNGSSIENFEYTILSRKRESAYQRKVKRIDDFMNTIPTVPDEMENWVKEVIFPEEYLFFTRKKKRTTYFCTACGSNSWTKTKWGHNETVICPKCGKRAVAKSRTHNVEKKQRVTLLQVIGKEKWAERLFVAHCKWSKEGKTINLYAEICVIIPAGETYGKVYYGQDFEEDEFMQNWWDTNSSNKRWENSLLYPGNLQDVLPMGNLQNSGMDIMARAGRIFEVNKFICTYRKRRYLEYLIKGGCMKMVADILEVYGWWAEPESIINIKGKTFKEFFKIDGNRANRLKQMDGGLAALKWLQHEEQNGSRISQETLEYLQIHRIYPSDLENLIDEMKSINRVVNYLKKQRVKPHTTIGIWKDYISMARSEGLNIKDDIVRFPKDLKGRHDALVEIINERRDKERLKKETAKYRKINKKIKEQLSRVQIYFWENEKYVFIPAGKCEELMKEGRTLHHCVGSSDVYMNRMASGESWILFLRRKSEIDKPYYTIEIDMQTDDIKQWYSEFNRKPNEEVIRKLLNEYKKQLKAARRKEAVVQNRIRLHNAG